MYFFHPNSISLSDNFQSPFFHHRTKNWATDILRRFFLLERTATPTAASSNKWISGCVGATAVRSCITAVFRLRRRAAAAVIDGIRLRETRVFIPQAIRQTPTNTAIVDNHLDIPVIVITNTLNIPTRVATATTSVCEVRLIIIAHSTSSPSCVFEETSYYIVCAILFFLWRKLP